MEKQLEPILVELQRLEKLSDFSGYLSTLKSAVDLDDRRQRSFFSKVSSSLTGGDVREGRDLLAAWSEPPDLEPVERYLRESEAVLEKLAPLLPANDRTRMHFEAIESRLQEGKVGQAMEIVNSMRTAPTGQWLFPAIFLLAALGAGAYGIYDLVSAAATMTYATTEGTVLTSRVVVSTSSSGSGRLGTPGQQTGSSGSAHSTTVYTPEVVYEYTVDGKAYQNDTWAVAHVGGKQEAEEIVASYAAGSKVAVHFDPENPQHAVLEKGARASTYVGLWLFAGFLLAALLLLVIPRLTRKTIAQERTP